MTAIALTIAGSDSGGGAGVQADLKTFSALGVYGASVVTALTAQNTLGVQAVAAVEPGFIGRQIDSVMGDLAVGAVKIGMLASAGVVEAVADGLSRHPRLPTVLDPVMVATSGDVLLEADAIAALVARLFPLADLVTPNLHEAARLTDGEIASDESRMEAQARILIQRGARAVLMKGGHGEGPEAADLLVTAGSVRRFAAPRLPTRNVHGTGCTLSSAIAAGLAKGTALEAAVEEAKAYVTAGIAASERLSIGRGAGPVHHFHGWW